MQTLTIGPQLADALARAALDVQGAPATGRKRMDAEHKLGRVLLAINGAPFGFRGALTPDRPPWPLPEPDPIITEARAEFGEPAPDPRRPDIDSESAYVEAMADLIGLALEKGRDPFALFAKAEALALKADDVARSPMFKRGEADARAGRAFDPPPIERETDRAAYVAGWERGRAAKAR